MWWHCFSKAPLMIGWDFNSGISSHQKHLYSLLVLHVKLCLSCEGFLYILDSILGGIVCLKLPSKNPCRETKGNYWKRFVASVLRKRQQLFFKNKNKKKWNERQWQFKIPTHKCFAAFTPVNTGNKFQLEQTLRLPHQVNAFPAASGC